MRHSFLYALVGHGVCPSDIYKCVCVCVSARSFVIQQKIAAAAAGCWSCLRRVLLTFFKIERSLFRTVASDYCIAVLRNLQYMLQHVYVQCSTVAT